jgi:hypothetical protein
MKSKNVLAIGIQHVFQYSSIVDLEHHIIDLLYCLSAWAKPVFG